MLFYISVINTLAIKLLDNDTYIKPSQNFLKTTLNHAEAANFLITNVGGSDEFLINLKDTQLVWDDPGTDFSGKVILYGKHGGPNQRWKFIFNKLGSFSIVCRNRRLAYEKASDTFYMKDNALPLTGEDGFMIYDVQMNFFESFIHVPVLNIFGRGIHETPNPLGKEEKKLAESAELSAKMQYGASMYDIVSTV